MPLMDVYVFRFSSIVWEQHASRLALRSKTRAASRSFRQWTHAPFIQHSPKAKHVIYEHC